MIDACASAPHFVDHLAPIWNGLDAERGVFWVTSRPAELRADHYGIRAHWVDRVPASTGVVLVASWGDVGALRGRPFIMVEHGAGETYQGEPEADSRPSDCGCAMLAMLCPSETVAARNRLHHPHAAVVNVGSPRVERLAAIWADRAPGALPVVALAWHWNSPLCAGSRWAFPHWRKAIAELAAAGTDLRGYDLLGHGHPRVYTDLVHWYRQHRIPHTGDPDDVIAAADVVVCDNSSFMWEAAACGIPIVMLDQPAYVDVRDGIRFGWGRHAGLHASTGDPVELAGVIAETIAADPCRVERERVATAVYGRLDGATTGAVAAIRQVMSAG